MDKQAGVLNQPENYTEHKLDAAAIVLSGEIG